jgi:WD40 repeat protein
VAELLGHTKQICSVAFSLDSRLLASASYDKTVRLWDVAGRKAASPMHVLEGHTDSVYSVSFSPNGRQLASTSGDNVRLWNLPEGAPGPVLEHNGYVLCLAFSPVVGSNMLASGGFDGIVRLWDVSTQKVLHKLQGHEHNVTITPFAFSPGVISSVAFSPDGSQLVSGSYDSTARLWSVASGKPLQVLTGHSSFVLCVAFHPNGKQVASCSFERKAVLIDTV